MSVTCRRTAVVLTTASVFFFWAREAFACGATACSPQLFLCVLLLFLPRARIAFLHAPPGPCPALSDPSQRSSPKNLKGFCKSNLRGNENTQTFFFLPPLNKTRGGQRQKKILQQKWGNSTNYHLSESNPVTLAKNMQRCKHGNRLLIWV